MRKRIFLSMTKEEYQIYLQSDHWKKLRQVKLEQSGRQCSFCGSKEDIQVHHLQYHNIYDVCLGDLQVLCGFCHKLCHSFKKNRFGKRCRKFHQILEKRIRKIKGSIGQCVGNRMKKRKRDRSFKLETRYSTRKYASDTYKSNYKNNYKVTIHY